MNRRRNFLAIAACAFLPWWARFSDSLPKVRPPIVFNQETGDYGRMITITGTCGSRWATMDFQKGPVGSDPGMVEITQKYLQDWFEYGRKPILKLDNITLELVCLTGTIVL